MLVNIGWGSCLREPCPKRTHLQPRRGMVRAIFWHEKESPMNPNITSCDPNIAGSAWVGRALALCWRKEFHENCHHLNQGQDVCDCRCRILVTVTRRYHSEPPKPKTRSKTLKFCVSNSSLSLLIVQTVLPDMPMTPFCHLPSFSCQKTAPAVCRFNWKCFGYDLQICAIFLPKLKPLTYVD